MKGQFAHRLINMALCFCVVECCGTISLNEPGVWLSLPVSLFTALNLWAYCEQQMPRTECLQDNKPGYWQLT